MTGFLHITEVRIPAREVARGQQHLRKAGARGNEGLVLWIGQSRGTVFQVTQAFVPRQRGIRTPDGVCVVIDGDALHELNVALYRHGLVLFGQVHSHPGAAYHSATDDEHAVATKVGSLSLVVPDFARRPFSLDETAVYRLNADKQWECVPPDAVQRLIRITP